MNAVNCSLLSAFMVVASLVPLAGQETVVPPDFVLRLEGGLCSGPAIDTQAGTFKREIDSGQWVTAAVVLTEGQRVALFEMVAAADLMTYPEEYVPVTNGRLIPASRHVISVQFSGQRRTIRWTDHASEEPAAQRLRTFVRRVRAYFEAMPEVARLPKQRAFCL